ncbi:MAG: RNA methyltransferase [Patescibacteria group bacterium]
MITKAQEKLIQELVSNKKTRRERGMFLIEGAKFVKDAKKYLEFSFTSKDSYNFRDLISTETPQSVAGVARIPQFTIENVAKCKVIVVLDNVQDPGNVGTIMRACLAFDAGLILVDSADPTNPKSVRASAAAILKTPWIETGKFEAVEMIAGLDRPVYKLELRAGAKPINEIPKKPLVLIAGNEGRGVTLEIPDALSTYIPQNVELESLNVAMATTIALYELS